MTDTRWLRFSSRRDFAIRLNAMHKTSGLMNFHEFHLDADEKGETRKPDSLFMEAHNSDRRDGARRNYSQTIKLFTQITKACQSYRLWMYEWPAFLIGNRASLRGEFLAVSHKKGVPVSLGPHTVPGHKKLAPRGSILGAWSVEMRIGQVA